MQRRYVSAVILLAVVVAGCSRAAAPRPKTEAADRVQIENAGMKIWDAFTHLDASGITAFYADDAVLMPTAAPMVRGKAAIHNLIAEEFKQFTVKRIVPTIMDVTVSGDLGVETGTFILDLAALDGTPISQRGKYLHVWQRNRNGEWRVIRYIPNFDDAEK